MHYSCLRGAPCLIRRSRERSKPRASRAVAILIAAAQTRSRSKYSERNPLKYGAKPPLPSITTARDGSACVIVIIRDVIRLTFFIFGRLCNGRVIEEAWLNSYGLIPWLELHLMPVHGNSCLLLKKMFQLCLTVSMRFSFSSYEFWKTFIRKDLLPSEQSCINLISLQNVST
jgi:hypothetical protein